MSVGSGIGHHRSPTFAPRRVSRRASTGSSVNSAPVRVPRAVFAPVDDAFGAIPEQDLTALAEDSDALTGVLTYHVVPGQLSPDEIAGTHTTVQGEDVEVTGEGDELMVEGATVICGGVTTQNATVYLVDTVLMPPSMAEQG